MKKSVSQRVLAAAIRLFAERGYFGVTIRDLAEEAGTNLHGVYRSFGGKDGAFEAALGTSLGASLNAAQLALLLLENRDHQQMPALIKAAAHRWYDSLSHEGARLIMHAHFSSGRKWEKSAHDYLGSISEVFSRGMAAATKQPPGRLNATDAARAIVYSLFSFKLLEAHSKSKEDEAQIVAALIEQSLKGLADAAVEPSETAKTQ